MALLDDIAAALTAARAANPDASPAELAGHATAALVDGLPVFRGARYRLSPDYVRQSKAEPPPPEPDVALRDAGLAAGIAPTALPDFERRCREDRPKLESADDPTRPYMSVGEFIGHLHTAAPHLFAERDGRKRESWEE